MNAHTEPSHWLNEPIAEPIAEPICEPTDVDKAKKIERDAVQRAAYENNKLEKRLCRQVGQAIIDYNMIEEGDRIMVCMSGGKDSYAMLDILLKMQQRAPIKFALVAVNLDQKQPGFPDHILPEYLKNLGVEFHIETQDTYSIVKRNIAEGKTMCSLCSRLRRGILYSVARRLKCNKLALGHHRDDMLQTFFLNMFFGGKLKGMPPKLSSDNGEFMVIRPLANVAEKDLIRWAAHRQFPIIPCTLCGSQQNLQRVQIGNMLRGWEKQYPGRVKSTSLANPDFVAYARAFGAEAWLLDTPEKIEPVLSAALAADTVAVVVVKTSLKYISAFATLKD